MTAVMTVTAQDRWKAALKTLRASGVRVRQNVQACCRGCISEEKLGMKSPDEAYAMTFGGQGNAYAWVNDELVYRESLSWNRRTKAVEAVYFNHGNGSAQRIADAFSQQGFDVEWNGTDGQCVIIKF